MTFAGAISEKHIVGFDKDVSVEVISHMICRPSIRVQNVMGIMVKLLVASSLRDGKCGKLDRTSGYVPYVTYCRRRRRGSTACGTDVDTPAGGVTKQPVV
jgi:hypothetical protein